MQANCLGHCIQQGVRLVSSDVAHVRCVARHFTQSGNQGNRGAFTIFAFSDEEYGTLSGFARLFRACNFTAAIVGGGILSAFGANAVLQYVARFSVMFISVLAVLKNGNAVSAITRVIAYDYRIRSIRDRLLAVRICLVLQLVVAATSICFQCAFRVRRFAFRAYDCAINFFRAVAVCFRINAYLDERAHITAARSRLYFTRLQVFLRILARLITSLFGASIAVAQVSRASVRQGSIKAVILRENPNVI